MYLCKKCHRLNETDRCASCGKSGGVPPRDGDFCLLTEKEEYSAGMLEETLKNNDIPFVKKPVMGAGLTARIGAALEYHKFYVSYENLTKAKELVEILFGENKY